MITQTTFKDNTSDTITADSSYDFSVSKVGGRLLKILMKYLANAFKEAGLKLKQGDSKKNADGSVTHKMTFMYETEEDDPENPDQKLFKEFDFYVNGKPTDDTKKYVDLSFKYPDLKIDPSGKHMKEEIDKYKDVPNNTESIMKKCQQVLNEVLSVDTLESFPEDLTACEDVSDDYKVLKFTVNKVSAAVAGYKLRFSNIYANYSPLEVRQDIDSIAGNTEFIDSLVPSESTPYGVLITDDAYNLEKLENFDEEQVKVEYIGVACNSILDQAYKLYCDSRFFSYAACGVDRERIISLADSYGWRIQTIIDEMSRRLVEYGVYLYNPCSQIRYSQFPAVCENQCPHWGDFETVMREDIQDLLSVFNLYASNFPKDEEAQILEWIRSWTSELNYNLARSRDN